MKLSNDYSIVQKLEPKPIVVESEDNLETNLSNQESNMYDMRKERIVLESYSANLNFEADPDFILDIDYDSSSGGVLAWTTRNKFDKQRHHIAKPGGFLKSTEIGMNYGTVDLHEMIHNSDFEPHENSTRAEEARVDEKLIHLYKF